MQKFGRGSRVRVDADESRVIRLQKGHGGWHKEMKKVTACFCIINRGGPKIAHVGNYMVVGMESVRLPMHSAQHQVNGVERMETSFRLNIFVTMAIIYKPGQQYVLDSYLHIQILGMKLKCSNFNIM